MLFNDFMTYSRLTIVQSLDVSCRTYLHKVLVAGVILGEKYEMVVASVIGILELVVIVSCDIYLTSDDRLYLRELLGHLQEFLDTVHVTVIGNGKCGHSKLLCPFKKAAY